MMSSEILFRDFLNTR